MADIQLNWYKVFCIVAKSKSYADASEKLNITPSSISLAITSLENVLDTKLFDRKSTGMTLTKQGQELYDLIGKSIEIIDFSGNYMLDKTKLENGEIKVINEKISSLKSDENNIDISHPISAIFISRTSKYLKSILELI